MPIQPIEFYSCFVFDCDGVILDSNQVKTQAFYRAALPYGETVAQSLVDYHIQNGGISRYRKFEYFLQNIIGVGIDQKPLNELLSTYGAHVREGLLNCTIAPGLQELRQALPDTCWLVASGGDQAELHDVFEKRGISHLFNGGIFGSPDTKEQILLREKELGNIQFPALFLGDSRYDYIAATKAELDFIFVSGWTEMKDWQEFSKTLELRQIKQITELLKLINTRES